VELHITLGPRREHATRIYQQLLEAILDGRLREGDRLPATRVLAEQLAVSRTTVSVAYERLVAEGYLKGRVGDGTYVRHAGLPDPRREPSTSGGRAAASRDERRRGDASRGGERGGRAGAGRGDAGTGRGDAGASGRRIGAPRGGAPPADAGAPGGESTDGPRPRPVWDTLPLSDTTVAPGIRYAFAIGLPDIGLFPFQAWRRLVGRELRVGALGTGDYTEPAGLLALRAAIARHYGVTRGLRASPDDVVVTQGAQQAIDLVSRVLIEPGTVVAMEDPGYPPARNAFASMGARVVGVPVDESGIVVDALPDSARVVYVTPSHQFPLGVAMSPQRRAALLAWARRCGAVIVEDDYDSEFRFTDRPLQPIHSVDRSGCVVYVGTFSKTMFPALRLGFLVAPPSLRTALRTAKQLCDWHTDAVSQAALARFIDEGLLARHIRRAARHYARRRELVLSWLRTQAPRLVTMPGSAGLHVTALVAPGEDLDASTAVRRAAAAGVLVRSVAPFYVDSPARAGIMLGYGGIGPDRITSGLPRLEAALRESG
jgi:GntR family transcriptional regulator/MocR family aminotransferase